MIPPGIFCTAVFVRSYTVIVQYGRTKLYGIGELLMHNYAKAEFSPHGIVTGEFAVGLTNFGLMQTVLKIYER